MHVDELLTTTRSVRRRMDFDRPVSRALIVECLELAIQAPSGSNREPWHWVVVTDPALRNQMAELYRRGFDDYRRAPGYAARLFADDVARSTTQSKVAGSAEYLAENFHRVPVLVVACVDGRPAETTIGQHAMWGSIFPAIWSFMLAARSRGLGTVITGMHLRYEQEAAEILGIPYHDVTQAALIPVAHYRGDTFRPVPRRPLEEVVRWL